MSRLLAGKSACATSTAVAGRVRGFCARLHQNLRPHEGVLCIDGNSSAAGDFDQPYLNLARLYVAQGDKDRAREILQQWLARHPDHAVAKSMLEKLGQ
jgi:FimV-like protein